ncbi:MAG: lycopene cyclase family protein, partial [Balneolales bacterium]
YKPQPTTNNSIAYNPPPTTNSSIAYKHLKYDYIIAGGGCAGLSMAWHLLHYGPKDKKTLFIDPDLSPSNTKTWCFWGMDEIPFVQLVYKTWNSMAIEANGVILDGALKKSPYHCIREVDYKKHILDVLQKSESIDLLEARVKEIHPSREPGVITDNGSFKCDYAFQSCFHNKDIYAQSRFKLKQHFVGWEIKTNKNCFGPEKITLMDFNTSQKEGVTFFYTLPFSKRHAIVEYTLFTEHLLDKQDYERALKNYMRDKLNLADHEYELMRSEQGCIPMVEKAFRPGFGENVMNLGAAGGITKPSTGYTFTRTQQQCRQIAESLRKKGKPEVRNPSSFRFRVYDIMLLQIIRDHPNDAAEAFYRLFRDNDFETLLQFLDEKTNLSQELGIFTTVPYYPFLRALYKTKGLILRGA